MQQPAIHPTARLLPGAVVVGDVSIAAHCGIWYNAVLRGDIASISVGKGTNIQDCCVLHTDTGFPLQVGDHVTVGHGAILHGCTVGNNSLIGMGAIVLNGAVIGNNCIVAAGALVTSGTVVPDGTMIMGHPAKRTRPLTAQEMDGNRQSAEHYMQLLKDRESLSEKFL